MGELIAIFAKAFLLLLVRLDKEKYKKTIDDFHARLSADPCGVLVSQLGGEKQNADSTSNEKCKGGDL